MEQSKSVRKIKNKYHEMKQLHFVSGRVKSHCEVPVTCIVHVSHRDDLNYC
jgi:hypothetical protein